MCICNYNSQRAEQHRQRNDKRVASFRKFEKLAFVIKGIALAVIGLGIIGMMVCVGLMFALYASSAPVVLIVTMCIMTAASGVLFVLLLRDYLSQKPIDDSYYDDFETEYHRLLSRYKNVQLKLCDDNMIVCLCEDNDGVTESRKLKPKHVRTATSLTQLTLDVETGCLWLPCEQAT